MVIPPWLAQMTGATAFANNPANGFAPTLGDAMQGIGHSMAEHYRRGTGVPPPGAAPMPAPSGLQMPGVPGGAQRPQSGLQGPLEKVPSSLEQILMPQIPSGINIGQILGMLR